ncbi:hypothetical protein PR003_g2422 [Phytophthora rubi]|uniref:Uncharacterized protein n=1 Tax=Phytophthora rubi TaxID=129364 RepID=A0A6A4G7M4_9STRA|nr:hypothetical protein PR001_g2231 [Phytophthora rubi]KAE9356233.1 hypothetical protein PR003_g2422 [Phytophthora rubi]
MAEEAARRARVTEARTQSKGPSAVAFAIEEGAVAVHAHIDGSDSAGATDVMEEKAAAVSERVRHSKKRSVSQAHKGEVEEADDVANSSVHNGHNSGAGKITGDAKKMDLEEVVEEDGNTEYVAVPPFQSEHKTWPLFEESLREYMHCTRQVIVVKENISIQRRNDALWAQTRYQGLLDEQIPLVPEEMKPFQRKYICTHEWMERERSKGTRKVYSGSSQIHVPPGFLINHFVICLPAEQARSSHHPTRQVSSRRLRLQLHLWIIATRWTRKTKNISTTTSSGKKGLVKVHNTQYVKGAANVVTNQLSTLNMVSAAMNTLSTQSMNYVTTTVLSAKCETGMTKNVLSVQNAVHESTFELSAQDVAGMILAIHVKKVELSAKAVKDTCMISTRVQVKSSTIE